VLRIRRTPSQLHSLQQIPTQHDMLPQHLVYKTELNREYVITLARNDETPWWWTEKIEICRSGFKCFKWKLYRCNCWLIVEVILLSCLYFASTVPFIVDGISNSWETVAFELDRFGRKLRPIIILLFLPKSGKVRAILPHTQHKFNLYVYNVCWYLSYIFSRITVETRSY